MTQNILDDNSTEIGVLYQTKIMKARYNLILESSECACVCLIENRDRVFIRWNIVDLLRITRFWGVISVGSINKWSCKNAIAVRHLIKARKTFVRKFINCILANQKRRLDLNVDHDVFSVDLLKFPNNEVSWNKFGNIRVRQNYPVGLPTK